MYDHHRLLDLIYFKATDSLLSYTRSTRKPCELIGQRTYPKHKLYRQNNNVIYVSLRAH
jgi:hypothetical protein